MKHDQNHQKYLDLRMKYPSFVYDSYNVSYNIDELKIEFHFSIGNEYYFNPHLTFPIKKLNVQNQLSEIDINNIAFHIGLIELVSYWKSTCSPQIIIKPHLLDNEQLLWWKKLYYNGLGEFFYLNNIKTNKDSFVEIITESNSVLKPQHFELKEKVIVPVGGGKDSVVSLELVKQMGMQLSPMLLNPNPARIRTAENAGYTKSDIIVINRKIDPELLKLNNLGFLNGHTPFSALLAFNSLLAAVLTGNKFIALSNESSANESTVADSHVNHQYSKSYEFESDFRNYTHKYICSGLEYFSLLRPLNELQIAKLFANYESYFLKFRSCNVGSKEDKWCGKCPKCLFTYIILSPFISSYKLKQIFSKNLFEDKTLMPILDELIGTKDSKPFECVGTLNDVNAALIQTIRNLKNEPLPILLEYYKSTEAYKLNQNLNIQKLIADLNPEHYLNSNFLATLITQLK